MKSLIAGVLSLFSLCAHSADADAIQRGKGLFMQHQCYSCHGTEGQGGERNAGPKIFPNCEHHATSCPATQCRASTMCS